MDGNTAWGDLLFTGCTMASTLGVLNPLRYRGYVYDHDTGLYYLQSRYYNPEWGRFLNADDFPATGQGLLGNNMFAYCGNNPVMRIDEAGSYWDTIIDVVSLCFSVVDVIKNPDDPWAWVGLAADVVSIVVPCVAGGGAIVKAATKADDVVDLAKAANKAGDIIDTSGDIVQAANQVGNFSSISQDSFKYTDKVLKQMEATKDLNHSFPSIIDTFADVNSGRKITGGDDITRTIVEIPGSINNKPGVFEYIIEPDGTCNHRFFRELK